MTLTWKEADKITADAIKQARPMMKKALTEPSAIGRDLKKGLFREKAQVQ